MKKELAALLISLSLVFLVTGCDVLAPNQGEKSKEPASTKTNNATLRMTPMEPGEKLLSPGFNDKPVLAESSSAYGCYLASSPYEDDVQVQSVYLHFPPGAVEETRTKTTSIVFRSLASSSGSGVGLRGVRYAHCVVPDTPRAVDLAMREVIRKGEQRALAIAAGPSSPSKQSSSNACIEVGHWYQTCAGDQCGPWEYSFEVICLDLGGGGGGGSGEGGGSGDGSGSEPGEGQLEPCDQSNPNPGENCYVEILSDSEAFPIWDILDWAAAGISLHNFVQDPTWKNLGWLIVDAGGALVPVLPAVGTLRYADDILDGTTDVLKSSSIFVDAGNGVTVPIPEGFKARMADTGEGIVFQRPGAPTSGQLKNRDMVRIMEPTNRYPDGYIVYYDSNGNPLDLNGVGGKPRADWHHGLDNLTKGQPMSGYVNWYNEMLNK